MNERVRMSFSAKVLGHFSFKRTMERFWKTPLVAFNNSAALHSKQTEHHQQQFYSCSDIFQHFSPTHQFGSIINHKITMVDGLFNKTWEKKRNEVKECLKNVWYSIFFIEREFRDFQEDILLQFFNVAPILISDAILLSTLWSGRQGWEMNAESVMWH